MPALPKALSSVLNPAFLRKLDRLRLTIRHSLSTRAGNTPMPRGSQGSGIEVESYLPYHPGDDLRHVDWNAYSRLGQLLVKRFRAEREAPLQIFVDSSASMGAPEGDDKLGFAQGLAASLAYVSLRHHDPVRIVSVSNALPDGFRSSPTFRHRQAVSQLRDFLACLQPRGATALAGGVTAALREQRTAGIAIVLSDFLTEPAAYETALAALTARRFTVAALRLIGPAERDPTRQFRRAEIVDAESGRRRLVTLTTENLARYERALSQHLATLSAFCSRCGVFFTTLDTSAGLEHSLFQSLPATGMIH
ncbi:MAG TPA: DUF58 domain-containing protein [Candidatus Acidoferrales bacterium]|nr:DUF58 domain-containing protein [Candidatus Acidoferrales bacterium]